LEFLQCYLEGLFVVFQASDGTFGIHEIINGSIRCVMGLSKGFGGISLRMMGRVDYRKIPSTLLIFVIVGFHQVGLILCGDGLLVSFVAFELGHDFVIDRLLDASHGLGPVFQFDVLLGSDGVERLFEHGSGQICGGLLSMSKKNANKGLELMWLWFLVLLVVGGIGLKEDRENIL
jgi:hypothetical protein